MYIAAKWALALMLAFCLLSLIGCRSRRAVETERVELSSMAGSAIDAARLRILATSLPCSIPVNLYAPVPNAQLPSGSQHVNNHWLIDYEVTSAAHAEAAHQQQQQEQEKQEPAESRLGLYILLGICFVSMVFMFWVSYKLRPL